MREELPRGTCSSFFLQFLNDGGRQKMDLSAGPVALYPVLYRCCFPEQRFLFRVTVYRSKRLIMPDRLIASDNPAVSDHPVASGRLSPDLITSGCPGS